MHKRTIDLRPADWSWAVGFNLLLLGIAASLRAVEASWILVLAWALLSEAIFVVLEPELIAFLFELPLPEKRRVKASSKGASTPPESTSATPGTPGSEKSPKDSSIGGEQRATQDSSDLHFSIFSLSQRINRRIFEIGFAILLAVFAGITSHTILRPPSLPTTVNAQAVIDQLDSRLKQCLDHTCSAGNGGCCNGGANNPNGGSGGNNSGGGALSLDPDLQQAIIDYLKQQSVGATASPNYWLWWGGGLVLVIIAAAVALALTVRKRPATAAPLGAVGLAAAIIKSENHFSRLEPGMWWYVFWLLAATLVALVVFAALQFNTPPADTNDDAAGEKKEVRKVESPLNIFFSVAVLLWAILLVCYRAESKPGPDQPKAKPQSVSYKRLPSITGFIPGKTAIPGRHSANDPTIVLIESLRSIAKPGDMLLLLGSADCTKIREGSLESAKNNRQLAEGRAKAVNDALQEEKFSDMVAIKEEPLDQNDGCNESKDLRAVFPVLIQHQP